jgi:hypothetical protein
MDVKPWGVEFCLAGHVRGSYVEPVSQAGPALWIQVYDRPERGMAAGQRDAWDCVARLMR